ncbi:hypothetical protein GCM10010106_48870 [Thermopolyspora flexuosa]|nr:hypothetical protein GCM10010106_48870 [Thermopolyspora flexuosa]
MVNDEAGVYGVRKIGQVTLAGTLVLCGAAACSAEEDLPSPPTPAAATESASPEQVVGRQPIRVELDPARVSAEGRTRSIRIRAYCPVPQGGTEHRATARSEAFTGVVTLVPPTGAQEGGGTPAAPVVTGSAVLRRDVNPGRYPVEVRCEGTNDSGTARLTVTRPRPTPTPTPTRTYPTRAPHAGGGGTAASGPADEQGIPLPLTGLGVAALVAGGVVFARRRFG